jgi:hypothetical protein
MVTGDKAGFALPDPPTYCGKSVTEPAEVLAGLLAGAEAAGAEEAAAAGAELAAAAEVEVELELEPELQAAAPATRQPATAIARHREPAVIECRIPVKRTIAPFRLSADDSPARLAN